MYRESVAWFAAEHLLAGGQPTDIDLRYDTSADSSADMVTFEPVRDWELVSRVHIRSWLVRLHRREYSSSYVNNQYRCLQQFFKWLADEEETADPMRKVKPPKVVAKPVPVFEEGEVDRILKMPASRQDRGAAKRGDACRLRDSAIIQLLRDTGIRLARNTLIRAHKEATSYRVRLRIAGPTPWVSRLLRLTDLDTRIPVFDTLDHALSIANRAR